MKDRKDMTRKEKLDQDGVTLMALLLGVVFSAAVFAMVGWWGVLALFLIIMLNLFVVAWEVVSLEDKEDKENNDSYRRY